MALAFAPMIRRTEELEESPKSSHHILMLFTLAIPSGIS
jgi:hypothetical protein